MSDEYWTIKMNFPEGARYLYCHDYSLRKTIAKGFLGSIASSLRSEKRVFDYCTLDGEAIEDSSVSGSDYATYGVIGAFSDNAMKFLVGMGVPESFFYPLIVKMYAFVPVTSKDIHPNRQQQRRFPFPPLDHHPHRAGQPTASRV